MKKPSSIEELKERYIRYFEDLPVQKYAAMSIGRNEDTIIRWRQEDNDFADAVQMAKAEYVRKKALAVKAEFALERLFKDVFAEHEDPEPEVPLEKLPPGSTAALARKFRDFMLEETKAKPENNTQ